MRMIKQVVLLMAHYGCNMVAIEQKYRRLREELSSERFDVVLLFNVNDKTPLLAVPNVDHICIYDLNDINSLNYVPICDSLLPGSCHFPVLKFHFDHPDYSYYWFLEYDVEFTGSWNTLMDAYCNNDADFIASHILHYHEDPSWYWWTHHNQVGYPLEQCLRAFHPICRYSHKALTRIHRYQSAGHSAHSEVLIPTCLYHAGLRLLDMGGHGAFIEQNGEDRFYLCNSSMNTMSYRPPFTEDEVWNSPYHDKLYHPLKP